jgi:hypothetical protein
LTVEVIDAGEIGDASWDELCTDAVGAWFWHTSRWRAYTVAYRPTLESQSLAFVVVDAGRPVALVPLMVEKLDGEGGQRFSFGGDACWSPVLVAGTEPSRARVALREALQHVDDLAADHDVDSVALRLSPLGNGFDDHLSEFLVATARAGYADVSLCSQVIDLDDRPEGLRVAMSKGHRADITRGRRTLETAVVTGADAAADFSAYRAMHALAAGRVTRPPATFDLMETWLATGGAALARATKDGEPVGFSYLLLHGAGAYYASAANHPDHGQDPIGHVLHAAAIGWLRERGIRRYEVGLQQFGPLPHDAPSAKDLGISRFKRGFGGRTVPLPVREKWYSADAYLRTVTARNGRYASTRWGAAGG